MNQVERGIATPWSPSAPATGGRGPVQRVMFASQKGGVAKTASAVNVAVALGQMGWRTLLVDTDPIGSVAACFGVAVPPGLSWAESDARRVSSRALANRPP